MDALQLPVLHLDDTLEAAVDAMDRHRRSGVLVDRGDRLVLAFVSEIRKAQARGARALREVRNTVELPLVGAPAVTHFGLSVSAPNTTWERWQTYLDSDRELFAIAERLGDAATVVTRHEGLTQMLKDTFYCDGPTVHYFPSPQVQVGEECPDCLGQPKGRISQK